MNLLTLHKLTPLPTTRCSYAWTGNYCQKRTWRKLA